MAKNKVTQTPMIVPIDQLKEFAGNPNSHPKYQIEEMAKSIEAYGQYYPIIIDENYTMLCGHGKRLALLHLGRTEANCLMLTGLSEKAKKRLVLEDNKIQTLSTINIAAQEALIKEIGDLDIIGFNEQYLDGIINQVQIDSMGVDFSAPSIEAAIAPNKYEQAEQQAAAQNPAEGSAMPSAPAPEPQPIGHVYQPEEEQEKQDKQLEEVFGSGSMTTAKIVTCPHCGQQFTI